MQKEVRAVVQELRSIAKTFRSGRVHKSFKAIQEMLGHINLIDPKFTGKVPLTANPYGIADRDNSEVGYLVSHSLCGRQGLPFSAFLKLIATNRPGNPFLPKEDK